MTGFVNEVTADCASIHHSSQSADNDASHLYLQTPSDICWQMAAATRSSQREERDHRCMMTHRAAKTYSVQFTSIFDNTLLCSSCDAAAKYKIGRRSHYNIRKWLYFLSNVVTIIIRCTEGNNCVCWRKISHLRQAKVKSKIFWDRSKSKTWLTF